MRGQPEPRGTEQRVELPKIAGYRIEGVLGRGGSSVVYRARQLSVDRVVALKVLHLSATKNESTVKRLRREARLMAMLDHPNIISAYDVGESTDGWWMSMELVEGQALSERLRRGGPLTEEEAIQFFVRLSDALQHAHEAGVIHRDVKPANILITPEGEPRLVDLGLARSEDEPQLTRVGSIMGTPHYVSPEQARNPASVDARSDVYSLAATLHDALCGAPPFPGESPAEVFASVLHDTLRDPRELHPGVSKGMSLVMRKALSKDPNRRHSSSREFAADLRLLGEGRMPRIQAKHLEPVVGHGRVQTRYVVVALFLAVLGVSLAVRGLGTKEQVTEVAATQTDYGRFEERWRGGELVLAEAMAMRASVIPSLKERTRYERLRVELDRELETRLFKLRSQVDASRSLLLLDRRFEEARSALDEEFTAALIGSTGFAPTSLPYPHGTVTAHWREREHEKIDEAVVELHAESAQDLGLWCDQELWRRVGELKLAGEFDEAKKMLEMDLVDHLEEAGVRADGLDLELLRAAWSVDAESTWIGAAEDQQKQESYKLDEAWDDLDERLSKAVHDEYMKANRRLQREEVLAVSDDFHAWASEHFLAAGLDLAAMPTRFFSEAAGEFATKMKTLKKREIDLRRKRDQATIERLKDESQMLLRERRYVQLIDWWSERERDETPVVVEFISLKVAETRLLVDLLDDARSRVVEGVESPIVLMEDGSKLVSTIRLEGDPVYERFWVTIAPGLERAWRLGGPPEVVRGVQRVSRRSLELLAGRVEPCLEVAFLRLVEGDVTGSNKCYRALDAGEASTKLGDELATRLGFLLAVESLSEDKRRDWARNWADEFLTQREEGDSSMSEEGQSNAIREVDTFMSEFGAFLDPKRRDDVLEERGKLWEESKPSTAQKFEQEFRADTTRFPRRGRVELSQRFDEAVEGAWDAGEWVALGAGWQAPRLAGVEEVLYAKAPTLLLRDPFDLEAGLAEVEFEIEVPQDARARLVVMSALGFHCAFVTDDEATGRVVAKSRDLEGVVRRALEGGGEEFPGLRPGESHRVMLRVNQARGTMSVLFDGEQCVRIADLSPKDRPRSTSVSLRSLEPLLLIGVRIEAGRR